MKRFKEVFLTENYLLLIVLYSVLGSAFVHVSSQSYFLLVPLNVILLLAIGALFYIRIRNEKGMDLVATGMELLGYLLVAVFFFLKPYVTLEKQSLFMFMIVILLTVARIYHRIKLKEDVK